MVGGPGAERRPARVDDAGAPSPTTPNDQQAPTDLASESSTARFTPYYTMFADPTGEGEDFVILRPFVPFSTSDQRTELQAYMTASSDPDNYGALTAYVVKPPVDGPRTVSNQIDSSPTITQQITLQTGGGNSVTFGDLQLVPVADGLLWVRPFYAPVRSNSDRTSTAVTEYRFVIVYYNGRAEFGESLGEALAKVFPGFEGDLGDRDRGRRRRAADDRAERRRRPDGHTGRAAARRPISCSQEAEQALTQDGDLGAYQDKVDQAKALVQQALAGMVPLTTPLDAGDDRQRRPLELLRQAGEILAEGDLVADLLVGQLDLAVAHRGQRLVVDAVRRRGVEGVDVVAELGQLVGQLGRHGGDPVVERGELVVQRLGRALAGRRAPARSALELGLQLALTSARLGRGRSAPEQSHAARHRTRPPRT